MYNQEYKHNRQGQKQQQSQYTTSRSFIIHFIVGKTFWVGDPTQTSWGFDA